MKKGITPVIAMILLILIVVALGGVFAAWTTKTFTLIGNKTEEHVIETVERFQRSIKIDNVDCNNGVVYIRNIGTAPLNTDQIALYVGGSYVSGSWNILPAGTGGTTIPPNGLAKKSATGSIASGTEVKITVGSGEDMESIDTYICP